MTELQEVRQELKDSEQTLSKMQQASMTLEREQDDVAKKHQANFLKS